MNANKTKLLMKNITFDIIVNTLLVPYKDRKGEWRNYSILGEDINWQK